MTAFEVPLSPTPQTFLVSLGNVSYQLTVRWCDPASCWTLDIADSLQNPILTGIPLVTGADLLAQFEYLSLGGQLIVQTDHDKDAVPTFQNLGVNGHLYFVTS
jgi:hypothetical protein